MTRRRLFRVGGLWTDAETLTVSAETYALAIETYLRTADSVRTVAGANRLAVRAALKSDGRVLEGVGFGVVIEGRRVRVDTTITADTLRSWPADILADAMGRYPREQPVMWSTYMVGLPLSDSWTVYSEVDLARWPEKPGAGRWLSAPYLASDMCAALDELERTQNLDTTGSGSGS